MRGGGVVERWFVLFVEVARQVGIRTHFSVKLLIFRYKLKVKHHEYG